MPRELQQYEVELANTLPVSDIEKMYGGRKSGLLINDGKVVGVDNESSTKNNPTAPTKAK